MSSAVRLHRWRYQVRHDTSAPVPTPAKDSRLHRPRREHVCVSLNCPQRRGPSADLRNRPVAHPIFRARRLPDRCDDPHRGQRRMAVESPAPLGLRQACHCTKSEIGSSPTWRGATFLSGVFQADLQSQRHGRRQSPARRRAGLCRGVPGRPFLVDIAGRRTRQQRPRRSRRRAALVATCARRRQRRRDIRLLGGRSPRQSSRRTVVRYVVPPASRRIHRHGQSRDDRRTHHRGSPALRRPVA